MLVVALTLLLHAVCAAVPTAASEELLSLRSPTATIDIGVLHGIQTSLPSATARVNKFLGVPFAESPQRFAPPVKKGKVRSPLSVTAWKPACMQQFGCKFY